MLGCYAGMSVRQGGPGFPFLHPHVYMYFCTNVWSSVLVPLDDLSQRSIQTFIQEVGVLLIPL